MLNSITLWRERLADISWFMRIMSETIAREANKEDQCTGRFWEGRFKSQALLDEKALLACMAYVDLNSIRALMARTPEHSAHTSVQRRCKQAQKVKSPNQRSQQPRQLLAFVGKPRQSMPKGITYRLSDYLALLDWSGRVLRSDKRDAINQTLPPLLDRLEIEPESWQTLIGQFELRCKGFVGADNCLQQACELFGYARIPNHNNLKILFGG